MYFASIDVLFNNAGTTISKPPFEHTAEDWRAIIDKNLNGVWFMASIVVKRMAERGYALPPCGGSIIEHLDRRYADIGPGASLYGIQSMARVSGPANGDGSGADANSDELDRTRIARRGNECRIH